MTATGPQRLVKLSPELGRLLPAALVADGRTELANSVGELEAFETCGCGDKFCTSFYIGPRPDRSWGPGHENLLYDLDGGMLVLDVVEGSIRFVELKSGTWADFFTQRSSLTVVPSWRTAWENLKHSNHAGAATTSARASTPDLDRTEVGALTMRTSCTTSTEACWCSTWWRERFAS